MTAVNVVLAYFWARGKVMGVKRVFLKHHDCGERVECI